MPSGAPDRQVTLLLKAWRAGDSQALEQLAPLVESELRRIARVYMRREGPNRTIQPTELINEAYGRLIECPSLLFPFARRLVADLTREGGFPPLLLDPINFANLLAQRQRDRGARTQETPVN